MKMSEIFGSWTLTGVLIFGTNLLKTSIASVALADFFAYGPGAGDLKLPSGDDNFANVILSPTNPFTFFNSSYSTLFVNTNGGLSFQQGAKEYTPDCGPLKVPMIIPFWADVNTINGGNVFYREEFSDPVLLTKAQFEIQTAFPEIVNLQVVWLFIATWADVAFYTNCTPIDRVDRRNTFQLILVKSGTLPEDIKSFAMFFFNDLQWTTGTLSGGNCRGLGGMAAKSGFDLGDGKSRFSLPGTCSSEILGVTRDSNVGQNGKWIFRIDESFETAFNLTVEPEFLALESGLDSRLVLPSCKDILVSIVKTGVNCWVDISNVLISGLANCKDWFFKLK